MSAPLVIASIVEGYGEVAALPLLVRKVALEVYGIAAVEIAKPHRVPRNQMQSQVLCRAAEMQRARIVNGGGVLVLADSDDDDPDDLALSLAKAAGSLEFKSQSRCASTRHGFLRR